MIARDLKRNDRIIVDGDVVRVASVALLGGEIVVDILCYKDPIYFFPNETIQEAA